MTIDFDGSTLNKKGYKKLNPAFCLTGVQGSSQVKMNAQYHHKKTLLKGSGD